MTRRARSTTRRGHCSAAADSACRAVAVGAGAPGGFNFDLGDLLGNARAGGAGAAGGIGDILGGIFSGGRRAGATSQQPRRGADVETEVTLDFEHAVHGETVALRMATPQPCSACHGTGAKAGTTPRVCPDLQRHRRDLDEARAGSRSQSRAAIAAAAA